MSHELRTPLNSIIGYTKLMLDGLEGGVNEEQKNDLGAVYRNGKTLLELINGLLDLSKIEAGKVVLSCGVFTLSDFLEEIVKTIDPLVREKGLTLSCSVEPGIERLYADRAKIRQVLVNILGNAVKFTPSGGIKLKVTEDECNHIFAVTDTGIGIKHEDLETIFDAFIQVGPAQIDGYPGTGLGLAVSKQFIEMQGGKIWAESEPGKGSTFTFILPKTAINKQILSSEVQT
jgi:signal transduction histidine kinase